MCPEAFLFLHCEYGKPGFFCHCDKICGLVYFYIAMPAKVCQWHFKVVHQPDHEIRRSIVAQNQTAAFSQNTGYTVKKVLRIWIVMEAVGADDRIEGGLCKRQVLDCHRQEIPYWKVFLSERHGSFPG